MQKQDLRCRMASEGSSPFFPAWIDLGASQALPSISSLLFLLHRVPYKIARRGVVKKSREWVLEKKDRCRRQGK